MPKAEAVRAKQIVAQAFRGCRSADQVHALLKRKKIKGVRGSSEHCPVAVLLRRLAPKGTTISAGEIAEFTFPDGRLEDVRLPRAAMTFIGRFDEGTHYQDRRAK